MKIKVCSIFLESKVHPSQQVYSSAEAWRNLFCWKLFRYIREIAAELWRRGGAASKRRALKHSQKRIRLSNLLRWSLFPTGFYNTRCWFSACICYEKLHMYSRLAFKSFYSVLNLLGKRLDTGSHMHKVVINVGCEPLAPFLWQEKTSY